MFSVSLPTFSKRQEGLGKDILSGCHKPWNEEKVTISAVLDMRQFVLTNGE